jgi:hypothetical protein
MIEREFLRHFEIRSLPYTHRHSTSDKQAIDSIHLDGGDEEEVCFGLPDSLTSVSEGLGINITFLGLALTRPCST